jgi:signal transduction histidine kinase
MLATLKLLIIDDSAGDRDLCKACLKDAALPADVREAEDGTDGLMVLRSEPIDCVMLDYSLPGSTGLDVLQEIRGIDCHVPVVMLTGHGSEDVAVAAMQAGAHEYLPKSRMNPQSLTRVILNSVERAALQRKIDAQREELENFAAVLAHDLTGPVTVIRGYAKLLLHNMDQPEWDRGQMRHVCDRIASGVDRMWALIQTLTEYTRPQGEVDFAPVALQSALSDALANLAALIEQRGAAITHGPLPEVLGSGPLLTQLLQNLIGNAIKYCEQQPDIQVAAAPADGSGWLVSVSDNGIGIPPDKRRNVFLPFKRLHRGDKYGGIGLGLATCKKIVEHHGGTIWCESRMEAGTTFFFSLPLVPQGSR